MSKTIKVIDLLNKIANGEDVPKKIKWRDKIWDYWEGDQDYKSKQGRWFTSNLNDIRTKEFVNDTVEIIDIQGIKELEEVNGPKIYSNSTFYILETRKKINELVKVINQINNK